MCALYIITFGRKKNEIKHVSQMPLMPLWRRRIFVMRYVTERFMKYNCYPMSVSDLYKLAAARTNYYFRAPNRSDILAGRNAQTKFPFVFFYEKLIVLPQYHAYRLDGNQIRYYYLILLL